MSIPYSICEKQGWLFGAEHAKLSSLSYPPKECPAKWSGNSDAISNFEKDICDGRFMPEKLSDPLSSKKCQDIVLALTDRYGFPVRTVINMETGIVRTDPYFSEKDLADFYSSYYRTIYTWREIGMQRLRDDQISRGNRIIAFINQLNGTRAGTVLDIGCGLGATLLPFRDAGWKTKGVDYGADLIEKGKEDDLDLIVGGHEDLPLDFHCDLIILSHVLEHQRDPISFLRKLADRWPSALLYIEVPGILNIHNAYEGNIRMYLQNAHAFHFCRSSLCQIAQIAGFECLSADESIQGLFKIAAQARIPYKTDAKEIVNYLKKVEFRHKFRLVNEIRKLAKRIKSKLRQKLTFQALFS